MYFKNTLAGLSLLAVCASAYGQSPGEKQWTEQAVLSLFEQQTPIKRETRAAASASMEALRSRTLWPNPIAAYSRETVGFTEFVQGEQLLPISGRLSLARKAMDPARDAVEADGAARIWDLHSNLRLAFYRALAAQRQEELIQASLKEIQQVIDLLALREREGEGSRYDRLRVERETLDLRADIAVARARARNEKTVLLSYLPADTSLLSLSGDVGSRPFATSAAELLAQALMNRADFRAQSSRLAQLSLEQQAADRLRRPEPMITAGMKRTQVAPGQNATGAVIGVSIPLPIFNKGQTEVARLSAEQDRIRAQREQLTIQVTATLNGAYDVHAARAAALTAFERETSGADAELLRIARIGYEEGELGILQLLDAYRLMRQTALRRLELQLAVKESEIELSRAAGMEVTQ
jgi:cobalt-zinc-cadmium efflux system outer membrane protein